MLTQKIHRGDAEAQRVCYPIRKSRLGLSKQGLPVRTLLFISLRLCVSAVVAASLSCGAKPTDPRTVMPGDALVYLETRDLGKTLEAVTDNPNFQQLAKTKPDLSALNGISLSVAVTGFETS